MKKAACASLLLIGFATAGQAVDQWPGQSDFSDPDGPSTSAGSSIQTPVVDFRFNVPKFKRWQFPPSQAAASKLPPAHFAACLDAQMQIPTRDISCAGPTYP